MAVSKMTLVSIVGLTDDLEKVLKICGYSNNFQPDDVTKFYSDTRNFITNAFKNKYLKPLEKLENIMDKGKFAKTVSADDNFEPSFEDLTKFTDDISDNLGKLLERKEQLENEYKKCLSNIEQTKNFIGLDVDFKQADECEYIKLNFGRLPITSYNKLDTYSDNPYVLFFPASSDKTHYWGAYVSPINKSLEVDRIFSGLYFEHFDVQGLQGTPAEYFRNQKKLKPSLKKQIENIEYKIKYYKEKNYDLIIKYYSKLKQLSSFYSISNYAAMYEDKFILVGWVPETNEKEFVKQLSKIKNIELKTSDGKEELDHKPPIKLKNSFLTRPFEYYTSMYSLPKYNEIDPTNFVAITYTVLFGVMFGDLGHGLILLLASLFMWKVRKMPLGKLLIPCSISSMIFGVVFGSFFGFEDVFNPIYKNVFGLKEKPINVMDPGDINTIIMSAIGVGVFLLIVAMVLNIYSSIKQKKFGVMIFGVNGITGLIFYTSLVVGLVSKFFLNKNIMSTSYILFLIVLPLLLLFFKEPLIKLVDGKENWKPEKIGSFISESFFELFEVLLSYVTNTMSFLRVGAFVLVHAGMMQVVFALAGMFGSVGYIVTMILGNALVIALEGLLVGIQVLRLEFFEMFNRFYEGGGREFKPVTVKQID